MKPNQKKHNYSKSYSEFVVKIKSNEQNETRNAQIGQQKN